MNISGGKAMETDNLKGKGRPENLKKGKKKGDPPSRKMSEQKVRDFCLYYLTHGESIKAAGLYVGVSATYVYEFFRKSVVQAKLQELREELDAKTLENAVNGYICTRQFLDETMARIIAAPRPHPRRGFADSVAAARLMADIGALVDRVGGQKQRPSVVTAQIIQTSVLGGDVYMPEIDRRRLGIDDPRCSDIEQKLLGSNGTKVTTVGAKNNGSDKGPE
jgi:hypothetical protein